jgi:hypothetical protein
MIFAWIPGAHAMDRSEALIKAGFLYNFAKYTEWPSPAPERLLCIAPGAMPADALDGIDQLPLPGSVLSVRHIRAVEEADACHILLLGRGQRADQAAWLNRVAERPTLSIADFTALNRPRAVIHLYMEGRRVRYDIHLGLARLAGLKFNPRLTNLAETLHNEAETP